MIRLALESMAPFEVSKASSTRLGTCISLKSSPSTHPITHMAVFENIPFRKNKSNPMEVVVVEVDVVLVVKKIFD